MNTTAQSNTLPKFLSLLALLALLFLLFMAKGTSDVNPKNPCNDFIPRQEQTILNIGPRLLGDLKDYPFLADRAVRYAFLAQHGFTDVNEMAQFHMNASYVRQTVREMDQGFCWNAQDVEVLRILDALRIAFRK